MNSKNIVSSLSEKCMYIFTNWKKNKNVGGNEKYSENFSVYLTFSTIHSAVLNRSYPLQSFYRTNQVSVQASVSCSRFPGPVKRISTGKPVSVIIRREDENERGSDMRLTLSVPGGYGSTAAFLRDGHNSFHQSRCCGR